MDIRGAKAIITGGAGGIGRACALMLAAEGADGVILADRDADGLARVADEVRSAGTNAAIEVADLGQPEAVAALFERAERDSGGLNIVHNNAGMMSGPPDFPDTNLATMIAAIHVNLVA